MSRLLVVSSDCHAGALPHDYKNYMPEKFHNAADAWWLTYAREMMQRMGTFFDQEAVEQFAEQVGEDGTGRFKTSAKDKAMSATDDELWSFLSDPDSMIAPHRGEYDFEVRSKELDDDGIAGEIIFPQMAPFGAGLMQYRHAIDPEQNLAGNRAYNRWLAEFCNKNPGRHAGVAIINVDDIEVSVQEVRDAHAMGLFGGVLLPSGTGDQPYYHHYDRYAPLWTVCEELDMPIHTHSGWSPDYGDSPAATPMFISEVDMWAHRPFPALLWSGVFEKHPNIKLVFTESGCSWILEALRLLEYKADNPLFAYFTKDLSLSPTEYFQRNCFLGASFLGPAEAEDRYRIGVDKIMWGSDYPHMEGTWPNTYDKVRDTFGSIPEQEIRSMMGTTAADVFGFDMSVLNPIAERVGPSLSDITG